MAFLDKIFGDPNAKVIKSLEPIVEQVNSLEKKYEAYSDEELRQASGKFREKLGVKEEKRKFINTKTIKEEGKIMEELLPDAFAVVREASKRVLKMRHYDVQIIGGVVLHRGQIAEMRTGEGKTLVATLPLYLNGLTGRGAHLVTVNDYLAKIGAGWMAPVYQMLGLSTGVIAHEQGLRYDPDYTDDSQYDERLKHFKPVSRKEAYQCDVVYGTNNEFGFDYLRDNMVQHLSQMVQKDLFFSIVDEVDSILIDEARTPLIISGSLEESTEKYYQFAQLVSRLSENDDYNVDEKMKAATLTEEGIAKMEKWLGVDNIYVSGGVRDIHHIEQALKARVLFKRDRDYVIKDDQVVIVDEFTGRLMEGRRYSEGLHQAIEAKEGVKIQKESQTLATITFQNYFRMYNKLSGMTGTAMTEAEEFHKIYNLEAVSIPTNKPVVRKDKDDLIYATEMGKFKAIAQEIKQRVKAGQPVLVGTISIEKNEVLSRLLEQEGVKHEVLNAKQHEREARIISQAGKPGAVTIATNMAGRGVDIVLGGSPMDSDEHAKVVEKGGLFVMGTERHESRRIDNQLRGRAGRQGDPGESQFYVSMEDDLMRIFGGDRMKKLMGGLKLPEGTPINNKMISRSIESAQRKVEGHNFDIRKHLVEYDDVISKHRETIYERRLELLKLYELQSEGKATDKTLSDLVLEMVEQEIEQVVSFHTAAEDAKDWNIEEIYETAATIFPVGEKLKDNLLEMAGEHKKLDKIKVRTRLIDHLIAMAKDHYAEIKKQSKEAGFNWMEVERSLLLRTIDALWVEHLETMDHMRRGIGLRGYGQRDPLVEYKKEAYRLFNELNHLIQKQIVYSVFKLAGVDELAAPNVYAGANQMQAPAKQGNTSTAFSAAGNGNDTVSSTAGRMIREAKTKPKDEAGNKIGRNDPCPCGSGKKYKKCCGV